jgi:hypothetical protein
MNDLCDARRPKDPMHTHSQPGALAFDQTHLGKPLKQRRYTRRNSS